MKPADALRLPKARLTDDQRKTIAKAIEMLETLYEPNMTRAGITIAMQCDDSIVLYELERHCKRGGWITHVMPNWEPPRIKGGSPLLNGFKMTLTPPQSAYDEIDAETRS